MTSLLQHLMAAHDAALAAHDAPGDDNYDKDNDVTGRIVDHLRDAILDHQPTLGEVATKAAFMAGRRTFAEWDNFDQVRLITALTPVGTSVLTLIAAYEAAEREYKRVCDLDDDNHEEEQEGKEAAEAAVIRAPCLTLDDVRAKARLALADAMVFDSLENCTLGGEATLTVFLRSLLGGAS